MSETDTFAQRRTENRLDTTGRQFFCRECRARCTLGTDGDTEYGHRTGCPQRPQRFPVSGGRAAPTEVDGRDE